MWGLSLDQQLPEPYPAESDKERRCDTCWVYSRGTDAINQSFNADSIPLQVVGKSSDNSSALANHRAQVYQTAYLQILKPAARAARRKEGFTFHDGSPSLCLAIFNILIAIMDYEEAYVFISLVVSPHTDGDHHKLPRNDNFGRTLEICMSDLPRPE